MSLEHRRRVFLAVAIPLGALVAGAAIIWAISRILLAAEEQISPAIGLLFALNILVAAALAASLPRKGTVLALVVAVVVPVATAGVVGAVMGEREIHSAIEEEPDGEQPPPGDGEEPGDGEQPPPGRVSDRVEITAENIEFDKGELALPANTEVTVVFVNNDEGIPHNWAMYTESGGEAVFQGEIFNGVETMEYTFTTPGPGTYYFQCDVHPNMNGTVTVVEAGGGGGGGGGEGGEVEITAENIAFDKDELALPPEAEVTVAFVNNDEGIPHNWAMYTEAGGEAVFQGEIFNGVETMEYTFTSPSPGEYYFQCDVHPNMNGTVTVG